MRQIFVALFVLSLGACGPLYETSYQFVPPCSTQGQLCIGNAYRFDSQCKDACHAQRDSCTDSASWSDASDYIDAQSKYDKKKAKGIDIPKPAYHDSSYSCQDDACQQSCENSFRQNYSQCGGQVLTVKTCVFNCGDRMLPNTPPPIPSEAIMQVPPRCVP